MQVDGQTSPDSAATSGAPAEATTDAAPAVAAAAPVEAAAAVSGAPEAYAEFKVPEGSTFADADKETFVTFAKDAGLTQEQAQKLLDRDIQFMDAQNAAITAQVEKWKQEVSADPVLREAANQAVAKEGLEKFASTELRQMLAESNLGNHPLVIKHFHELGKLVGQDKFVSAPSPAASPKSLAERLYGTPN